VSAQPKPIVTVTVQPPAAAFEWIPIGQVREHPANPRKNFDKEQLADLIKSVKEAGVLNPLLVRPLPVSNFQILAGHRRFRAAKAAGLESVPAIVRELDDDAAMEVMLIDNLQRSNLHPLEEAEGYTQLLAAKYGAARIAERMGRSVKYVYDRVKLLSLTKELQKLFLAGEFTAGHAVILARLKSADQKRALEDEREYRLFTPEEEDELPADHESRKARSVRELQAWVDKHTKVEVKDLNPMLFPETLQTIAAATAHEEKVVRITHDDITPEEARDGQKIILGRSWKRADGEKGSKQCDRSVIGMVVIGAGRGQALRVCIDKKRCTVHWGDLIKAAKKREKAVTKEAATTGQNREDLARRKEKEEHAREEATRARWMKAAPAICAAIAGAIRDSNATAKGPLAELLNVETKSPHPMVPPGKTAEDLVRHLAYEAFMDHHLDVVWGFHAYDRKSLQAGAKEHFGIDVQKIVDQAAPHEP